jgi:hypothetical protein
MVCLLTALMIGLATPAPSTASSRDGAVVARVDGITVTEQDVTRELSGPRPLRYHGGRIDPTESRRHSTLERLIDRVLLLGECRRRGLSPREADVLRLSRARPPRDDLARPTAEQARATLCRAALLQPLVDPPVSQADLRRAWMAVAPEEFRVPDAYSRHRYDEQETVTTTPIWFVGRAWTLEVPATATHAEQAAAEAELLAAVARRAAPAPGGKIKRSDVAHDDPRWGKALMASAPGTSSAPRVSEGQVVVLERTDDRFADVVHELYFRQAGPRMEAEIREARMTAAGIELMARLRSRARITYVASDGL